VRVLVKKYAANGDAGAAEHSGDLPSVIVATQPRRLEAEAAPNKSWMDLQTRLQVLPLGTESMAVAPVAAIRSAQHGGMVLQVDGTMHPCSCVLTFIAHTGKSHGGTLASVHRIASKDIWSMPCIGAPDTRTDSAPEHAGRTAVSDCAPFCTMDNVQYDSMFPMCGEEPVYAMLVISNFSENDAAVMHMLDTAAEVGDKKARAQVVQHLKKLSCPLGDGEDEPSRTSSRACLPSAPTTHSTVRNTRHLSLHPTGGSLPSPGNE